MAQSLPANDYRDVVGRAAGDFVPLGNDPQESVLQSQVDRLISDLMDIIVRAAAANCEGPKVESTEAVAEVVALSMM